MIAQEIINSILDRADIVEVVARSGVELRKAGRDFVACCPFHKEKTASFHVSPSRQTWHCFGQCQEGGNVIAYVMRREGRTFPEAVKELGARYGIDVAEREESAAEHTARLKRERMRMINEEVARWYAEQLRSSRGKEALAYAEKRWGAEYVAQAGVGFAPNEWEALLSFARTKDWPVDLLLELGLLRQSEKNGRIYDFYKNRLMIPIRSRSGLIEGFTARDLSGDEHAPKYLNSPESAVYKKGTMVWGLDTAAHEAARQDKMIIVEGAADAMKMQSVGIANVVAPLGGSVTAEQLKLLRRTCRCVCFINDADPWNERAERAQDRYGAGVAYVIKNGEEALRCGFTVSVRELLPLEGNLKQDPGSFFETASCLDMLKEENFITWAAGKLFSKDDDTRLQAETVKRVAGMLSFVSDDVQLDMLLPDVAKQMKGTRLPMLKNLVTKLRWERTHGEKKKRGEVNLQDYGFYAETGSEGYGYWARSEKDGEVQWSNFTMRPLFHIKSDDKPLRLFYLKNEKGREDIVEMTMEDLNSPAKFRQKIEGIGNYLWMGGDREMVRLKRYLYDQTEAATIVGQMGWNFHGFYAWGNGLWAEGAFHKADEYGIVRWGEQNWYIPAASKLYKDDRLGFERERKFVHLTLQNVHTADYLARFARVYGENGKVGLCYYVASLFRDIIVSHTDKFPLLNLFGPKGSGKSQMAAALMAFFVTGYKAPNIQSATPAALSYEVASTSNALCHIDEYKNDIDARRIDFLKGLYDGAGRMKMGGASYDKVEMTAVNTGIILSGQELPTADIALFHRCVFLSFPKSTFSPEEKARFDELRAIQRLGLTSITLDLLAQRGKFEATFRDTYALTTEDLNRQLAGETVETRLLENWAKVLAAFRCVESGLAWPMSYEEMLEVCTRMLRTQNKMSGEGNELGRFWDIVQYLHDEGEIREDGDYMIREKSEIKTDLSHRTFPRPTRLLFVAPTRLLAQYRMVALRKGDKPLPEDALREYLKNAPYYLGLKAAKFKFLIDGVEQHVKSPTPGANNVKLATRRALVFDYDTLCATYSLTLETTTETEGEAATEKPLPF